MNKSQIAIREVAKRYRFEYPWIIPVKTSDGRPLGAPYQPWTNRKGYPVISFRKRGLGIDIKVQVHQAVAYQLYGEAIFAPKVMCRHRNNIKTDFRSENIILGTALENHLDNPPEMRQRLANTARSMAKKLRKLTDDQVRQCKQRANAGEAYSHIAKEYGVATNTVRYAVLGLTYQHIK